MWDLLDWMILEVICSLNDSMIHTILDMTQVPTSHFLSAFFLPKLLLHSAGSSHCGTPSSCDLHWPQACPWHTMMAHLPCTYCNRYPTSAAVWKTQDAVHGSMEYDHRSSASHLRGASATSSSSDRWNPIHCSYFSPLQQAWTVRSPRPRSLTDLFSFYFFILNFAICCTNPLRVLNL